MWELDCEEGWAPKNWCFWTVVLEKTPEGPLNCQEIQPVHPKGNQSWVFIGRTDAEAETPIVWPPDAKVWLIWKDFDVGRDWGQEEKGTTEDEMAGWHHWFDGHESQWTLGVGDGQGGLACFGPWGCKESDTTEWLNRTELMSVWWQGEVHTVIFSRSYLHTSSRKFLPMYTVSSTHSLSHNIFWIKIRTFDWIQDSTFIVGMEELFK